MNIIQSFAQLDNGNVYIDKYKYNNDVNLIGTETYLLFYSSFLSYLTLKKYYGSVTMYCNKKAYDTFIKYIPYDRIIIKENKKYNDLKFWSAYKLDVIEEQTEDFIHVDSDVFIFNDLFKPFINNNRYDIIVQQIIDIKDKPNIYKDMNVPNNYDYRSFSCGVIGLRKNIINNFINNSKSTINKIKKGEIHGDNLELGIKIEEFSLYLTYLNFNYNVYDIIPYADYIKAKGAQNICSKIKYTHLVLDTKFYKSNIDLIKNKIKTEFADYYDIVEEYDKYISKINIIEIK